MRPCLAVFIVFLTFPAVGSAQTIDLDAARLVDLTHPFNAQTIYWPTSPSTFELEELAYGHTEGGYFYSAHAFCSPEHGGTHLDAPIHFAEGRHTTEQIPLDRLVGPAVVIDISGSAARDADYRLTAGDVLAFEQVHGTIQPGTIVLLRTGWSRHWPDRRRYLGDDTPGDASRLHFPSYGEDAARLLVEERGVAVLGADVASIDYGQSRDFIVHRIAAARNVPGLENLTNLDALPPTGAVVIALPMKIEGGSGGPLRAVAIVPNGGGASTGDALQEDRFVAAARTVIDFLRGDADGRALALADTVTFHLAPEGGGGTRKVAASELRDRAEWRIRGDWGQMYPLVPPAGLSRLTTRFGSHLKCFEYPLARDFPELARLPHVGTRLEPEHMTSCLQTWNLTLVFQADTLPATLTAVVYDQWEW